MNNYIKLASVLVILPLAACQPGKVSSESSSSVSSQSLNPNTVNAPIDLGSMSNGVDLQVQANATPMPSSTPTPTPTPLPTPISTPLPVDLPSQLVPSAPSSSVFKQKVFLISRVLNVFVSDSRAELGNSLAPPVITPDSYQFYSASVLLSKLSSVVGAQLTTYQSSYQAYSSSASAVGASVTVPDELQKLVTISFLSANGKTSSLTAPLVKILNPKVGVITYGSSAYIGVAEIPAPNSTFQPIAVASLSSATFLKVGTAVKVMGGISSGVANRAISNITFSGDTFELSTSPATISSSASLSNAVLKPMSLALATSAGLVSATYVGKYLMIASVNSLNKIFALSLLNLTSGVITASTVTCASVVSHFSGLSCPVVVLDPGAAIQ